MCCSTCHTLNEITDNNLYVFISLSKSIKKDSWEDLVGIYIDYRWLICNWFGNVVSAVK